MSPWRAANAHVWQITPATSCNYSSSKIGRNIRSKQKSHRKVAFLLSGECGELKNSAYRICMPTHHAIAATNADAGIVTIHAQTILPATPQRTADILCDAPTPTMAPVMVCVVETGTPIAVAMNSVMAPPVSAQKLPTGLSLVIFWPMVLTMRHPPNKVPRLIAQ